MNPQPCIEWRYEPEKAVSHVAIGETSRPGGQWADNPVAASAHFGTLSYAEMLSLPGYSYSNHLAKSGNQEQCDFVRPNRTEVAEYLEAYPDAVGIADAIYTNTKIEQVSRTSDGFIVGSRGIRCKHLVLASGIFSVNISPPPLFSCLTQNLKENETPEDPVLVIGSGFSAADIIISTPPDRKIIHLFRWAPDTRPSPLRGCHHSAYPEYASIYRQMKSAAIASTKTASARSPLLHRKSNPFFSSRDWTTTYEGFPNAEVIETSYTPLDKRKANIRLESGKLIVRDIGKFEYVVGRRGNLDYLSPLLQAEVLGIDLNSLDIDSSRLISSRTLRAKAESSLEVVPNVFIIGSLAGDSLIRHAVGSCVYAAGRIMKEIPPTIPDLSKSPSLSSSTQRASSPASDQESSISDLHHSSTLNGFVTSSRNGHDDLHLDKRKLARAVEIANAQNDIWADSGWWAGGLGVASRRPGL